MSLSNVTERSVSDAANAIALILTIEKRPGSNPETIKLCPASRKQLQEALAGLDPFRATTVEEITSIPIEETDEDRAKAAISALSRFTNVMSHSSETFSREFFREHRTLQQGIIGLFLDLLRQMSDPKFTDFDLRTEASVHIARRIREALGEFGFRMPYI